MCLLTAAIADIRRIFKLFTFCGMVIGAYVYAPYVVLITDLTQSTALPVAKTGQPAGFPVDTGRVGIACIGAFPDSGVEPYFF